MAQQTRRWNPGDARLVKILERPAGQQLAPSPRPLESAIAVGYVVLRKKSIQR